jgi:hypothetical protein
MLHPSPVQPSTNAMARANVPFWLIDFCKTHASRAAAGECLLGEQNQGRADQLQVTPK